MEPNESQMSRSYKGKGNMSPYDSFIDMWHDERKRETDTATSLNRPIMSIDKDFKESGKTVEVSGDALNRAKNNQPPKMDWDVAKDVWDSMAADESAKFKNN
jgi:hypothetical protein